ncbi:ATP-binding protein [Mucilaginibacter sp. RS28]|uniref:ATP-binding protein n=1 Tax=Mucilaginibacter straminoryzae TaxID=2932774 RepID=A0A9X1X2H8_9SPHI|nr:ATP-binding protein [Mucilaginibacter straminoryzae]MCJ8208333.1 ATP-binding protein [Mucilaginibacter straminoryzae]
MGTELISDNAAVLTRELQWLAQVIDTRMTSYFQQDFSPGLIEEIPPPDLSNNNSVYAKYISHYKLDIYERIILLLALAPHLQPQLLDTFFTRNSTFDRPFTEFGGIKGKQFGGFLPTGETAAFILAVNDLEKRIMVSRLLSDEGTLNHFNLVKLVNESTDEPQLSGLLKVSGECLSYCTLGTAHKPDYSTNFPAKLINTSLDWSDLVLDDQILHEVEEIKDWLTHGGTLMNDWGMKRKLKAGFRSLFYGPPGTGKTLTASLLGKATELDVYRIDLSMVVSKYIGETEKNLAGVFDQAERKNWILFFDEADALFGKRTQTSSSNDRYANQEVSYLLQRIEDFDGVIILSTNIKANLDEAFSRRFQSMIHFSMPGYAERERLWRQAFSEKVRFEDALNIADIAKKYELAGGAIINVVRYASLQALKRGDSVILHRDIVTGIRREFSKDGKTV